MVNRLEGTSVLPKSQPTRSEVDGVQYGGEITEPRQPETRPGVGTPTPKHGVAEPSLKNIDVIARLSLGILRRLPEFRGRGRIAATISRTGLAPCSPLAVAPMRLGHEMIVDVRSRDGFMAYYMGDYDTAEIRSVLGLLDSDSVVVDVGANIGLWTVPLARHVKHGQVHAFEPVKSNFKRLRENALRNSVQSTTILNNIGLSDSPATLLISLREDFSNHSDTGNAAIVIDAEDRQFLTEEITVDTLDNHLRYPGVKRLDLIKVDIEGHEDRFLKGATESIRRFRPAIFLEINDAFYLRRSLDPTELFSAWMRATSYVSVLHERKRWQVSDLDKRRRGLDNVLFLPQEHAGRLLGRIRH
jgi:FkbM family methyltransferase